MNRRASTLFPIVGLVVLVALPIAWRFWAPPIAAAALAPTAPLLLTSTTVPDGEASSGVEVALLRAGVSPKALAAVGAPTQGLFGLVEAAQTHFTTNAATLTAADAGYATAKRESDRLRRLIESGKGTQEDVADYQTQSAALAAATAQQDSALNALFEATTAALTSEQRASLRRIHAARTWGLPTEFLVVERSQQAWVELRSALANERFAAKYHETSDPAAQAVLASARSDAAVAAAATGIETNLAYVTASWTSALGG